MSQRIRSLISGLGNTILGHCWRGVDEVKLVRASGGAYPPSGGWFKHLPPNGGFAPSAQRGDNGVTTA